MGKRSVSKSLLESLDLEERKYLLTHDDATSKLTVHIGRDFPDWIFSQAKDEVLAEWQDGTFHAYCYLDNEKSKFSIKTRFDIFKANMRNAILAICMVDEDLKSQGLDKRLIISYISQDPKHNSREIHASLADLVCQDGRLGDFDKGYDYSQLRKVL